MTQSRASSVLHVDDLASGDVIITEIMINPAVCNDTDGEYFEIYNATSAGIDFDGLVVVDGSGSDVISGKSYLAAESYGVAVKQTTSQCYGLEPVFEYTRTMNNGADKIELWSATTMVDSVDFGVAVQPWSFIVPGASVVLDLGSLDATLNDDGANWCVAQTAIETPSGPSLDKGSPSAANSECSSIGE